MNPRFLISVAALALVIACLFSVGVRAQPGSTGTAGPDRTLDDIDPGTPIARTGLDADTIQSVRS